jgi:hypothetical protein
VPFDPTQIGAYGGDGNYSYYVSGGAGVCYFNGLYTGMAIPETITVTDGHNCSAQFNSGILYVDDQYDFTFVSQTNASCPNGSDGTYTGAVVDMSGLECNSGWSLGVIGTSTSYSYATNGSNNIQIVLTGLAPDTYTYTISGPDPCSPYTNGTFTINAGGSLPSGIEYDTICHGGSFTWNGNSYSQSGSFIDTLIGASVGGCDSIDNLTLTILPALSSNLYDTLVTGDTLYAGGHAYTRSGIYYDTITGTHGCDSMLTIYLYVGSTATFANLFDTVCQGFSIVIGNHTYTISGTYIDTLTGTYGGDSIVTLNLVINQALLSNSVDTICQGSSVTVGIHTYSQSGTYVDTLTSVGGCDSVHALELTVLPVVTPSIYISVSHGPVIAGMQTDTFTASSADCTDPYYSWYRDIVPLGIHSTVAVVTYPAGTQDSISCEIYCNNECQTEAHVSSNSIYTGITDQIASIQSVDIYPNPTQGSFNMDINATAVSSKDARISVTDMVGQNILSMPVTLHSGHTHEVIYLGEKAVSGVYLIQLTVEGQSLYYRIVLDK